MAKGYFNGMYREGIIERAFGRATMGVLKTAGQAVLGIGEGIIGRGSGFSRGGIVGTAGRLAGRAVGATTRVAGQAAYHTAAPAAKFLAKDAYRAGTALGKAGYEAGAGVLNLLTKKTDRSVGNLFTGRMFRDSTVAAASAATIGIPVFSGMRAVSEVNTYGNVYGNPQMPNPPAALSYDGMNATGDLTLALSRNRHG